MVVLINVCLLDLITNVRWTIQFIRTYLKKRGNIQKMKKITFLATKDIKEILEQAKKEMFQGCSDAEMIRELVKVGLQVKAKELT